jgi:hypothetical protein
LEKKEMNEFVAIFNLMKQAPEFSVIIGAFVIYLIYDKNKSFFIIRDNKHKEKMENFFAEKIKDSENRLQENMKHFVVEQISFLEIRMKDYIDQKFKDLKSGL